METEPHQYTSSYTTTPSTMDSGEAMAILMPFFVIMLAVVVVQLIAMWKIYTKAGEKGWKALIPIYSSWVFLRMGGQPSYWAILAIVPILNIVSIVFMILAAINIGKKLGKQDLFVLLYIFIPIVWAAILGFGKSTWKGEASAAKPAEVFSAPAFNPSNSTDKASSTETK